MSSARGPLTPGSLLRCELRSVLRTKPEHPYRVVAIDFGIKRAILDDFVPPLFRHGASCQLRFGDCAGPSSGRGVSLQWSRPAAVRGGISLAASFWINRICPCSESVSAIRSLAWPSAATLKLTTAIRTQYPCGTHGQVEITSQNHGFALDADSLDPKSVEITHLNLNDRTVAALQHRRFPVFGVQYHPEASPGPHDADHHFARFVALMADRRA